MSLTITYSASPSVRVGSSVTSEYHRNLAPLFDANCTAQALPSLPKRSVHSTLCFRDLSDKVIPDDNNVDSIQAPSSAVVGSQVQGSYLPVSRPFISSSLSSKSNTFVFSSILEWVTLLGRTTKPFCKPQRSKICAGVLLYLDTSGLSRGSSPRVARTRGE
jgi:hypothetical protein